MITKPLLVVSYSISTSNHNRNDGLENPTRVVSYSISTSNHNTELLITPLAALYLIPFLHQTTTYFIYVGSFFSCILFHFYIKPQHWRKDMLQGIRCILFHFYIKPQPVSRFIFFSIRCILFHFYIKPQQAFKSEQSCGVVSYSISTSNHNIYKCPGKLPVLYLIPFLHQTTTLSPKYSAAISCILFHFYIKPQHALGKGITIDSCILFHFYIKPQPKSAKYTQLCELYLIPFLHQTTTSISLYSSSKSCILFHFYIKPQHAEAQKKNRPGCILFHFYIKPQLCLFFQPNLIVVSYSISTSNHNLWRIRRSFQAHYHLNHILIFNGML